MKKIERTYIITHYSTIKGLPDIRYVKVKESDLDELEQQCDEAVDKITACHDYLMEMRPSEFNIEKCFNLLGYDNCGFEELKAGKDERI